MLAFLLLGLTKPTTIIVRFYVIEELFIKVKGVRTVQKQGHNLEVGKVGCWLPVL